MTGEFDQLVLRAWRAGRPVGLHFIRARISRWLPFLAKLCVCGVAGHQTHGEWGGGCDIESCKRCGLFVVLRHYGYEKPDQFPFGAEVWRERYLSLHGDFIPTPYAATIEDWVDRL